MGNFWAIFLNVNLILVFIESFYHPSSLNYLLEYIVVKFHNHWLQNSVITTIRFFLIQAQLA